MEDGEIKEQVERLEAVRKDAALLATVSRVVAAQFGVVPLAELPGGGLEVAHGPLVHPDVLAGLGRALARPVRGVKFEEGLVQLFVSRLYLQQRSLNFHTFREGDFLERPEALKLLLEEKPMEPVAPALDPDPERLVLCDFAYRSVLRSIDPHPASVNFEEQKEAATELVFAVDEAAGEATLARPDPVPPEVFLLAQESYAYQGLQHMHGFRGHDVKALPFMIHPSEIQVTGLRRDGSIDIFVYDEVRPVRPGERPRFDVTYHFLSMGQRLERKLALKVYRLVALPRDRVRPTGAPLKWEGPDMARWLGHDL